jgi:hypothetical protein
MLNLIQNLNIQTQAQSETPGASGGFVFQSSASFDPTMMLIIGIGSIVLLGILIMVIFSKGK